MNIDAKKVLVDFISAMNSWELTYYPLVRDNGMLSIKDKMGGDLNEIFDTFCTKKENKEGKSLFPALNRRRMHLKKRLPGKMSQEVKSQYIHNSTLG